MTEVNASIWGRSREETYQRFVLNKRNPAFAVLPPKVAELEEEAFLARGVRKFVDRNGQELFLFDEEAQVIARFATDITGVVPFFPVYAFDYPTTDGSRRTAHFYEDGSGFDANYGTLRSWEYSPQSTAYWIKDIDTEAYFVIERTATH